MQKAAAPFLGGLFGDFSLFDGKNGGMSIGGLGGGGDLSGLLGSLGGMFGGGEQEDTGLLQLIEFINKQNVSAAQKQQMFQQAQGGQQLPQTQRTAVLGSGKNVGGGMY